MRPQHDVDSVLALLHGGLTTTEIAGRTRIPRSTVRDWRTGLGLLKARGCAVHALASLDAHAYAYLLGIYLGDGCISPCPRGVWNLRITLDSAYPGIVAECVSAVDAITPGKAHVQQRRDERAVEVSNYWKHWTCLIPQHGPGRKHERPIHLAEWQRPIVEAHVELFLRGLIHSDGTRIIATERKGSYVRRAPRYAFSTRSEDILGIFRTACEVAGIHCTRASQEADSRVQQVSRRASRRVRRPQELRRPRRTPLRRSTPSRTA